jgi:hypothetical protein
MTDQRRDAPHKGLGENPELRQEADAREFENISSTGGPMTKSTGDQVGGQSEHSEKEQDGAEPGLPDNDEQSWEGREVVEDVVESGDGPALDDRHSDDKER